MASMGRNPALTNINIKASSIMALPVSSEEQHNQSQDIEFYLQCPVNTECLIYTAVQMQNDFWIAFKRGVCNIQIS